MKTLNGFNVNETMTLKVYRLSSYRDDAGLIVVSDTPEVGIPISLQVLRDTWEEELPSELEQQTFIAVIQEDRKMLLTVNTEDYALDETEIIYSITWKEEPNVVH